MGNPDHTLSPRGPLDADASRARFIDDTAKAAVEEIIRAFISSMPPATIIAEAKRKDALIQNNQAVGPRHHNAVVDTLFELLDEMQRHIQKAPVDPKTLLPIIPGVKWDLDDPLAPLVEVIEPFGMSNFWTKVPVPAAPVLPTAPRRRRVRKATLRPRTSPSGKSRPFTANGKVQTPGISAKLKPEEVDLRKKVLQDGGVALFEDLLGSVSFTLNMLLLAKTAFDYLKAWVTAKNVGLKIAERHVAGKVMADGIASMAVKLGPPNMTRKQPRAGGFQPPDILPWQGVSLPEPDAIGVKEDLDRLVTGRVWNKRVDIQRVVNNGRALGLKFAKDYIQARNTKKSGDGYMFLWALKAKYKGKRWAIRRFLVTRIRAELQN